MARSQSLPASVTDPGDDARAPLRVETDLTISVEGVQADVDSTGERLLIQFRSVPDLLVALRNRPAGLDPADAGVLTVTALTAEVRVRDRIVALAGAEARPGRLARVLGVDPVEIRVAGAVGSLGAELLAALDSVSEVFR